jgi:hypothetical protein
MREIADDWITRIASKTPQLHSIPILHEIPKIEEIVNQRRILLNDVRKPLRIFESDGQFFV